MRNAELTFPFVEDGTTFAVTDEVCRDGSLACRLRHLVEIPSLSLRYSRREAKKRDVVAPSSTVHLFTLHFSLRIVL